MLQHIKDWQAPVSWCTVHRKHEDLIGSYTDCMECGHVYETYEALKEEHRLLYSRIGNGKRQIGIITYCPLCLHDF